MTVQLGRFTDSFKPKAKVEAWNLSEKLFLEKKFLDSYEAFFDYIKDDAMNNISYSRSNGKITFEFYQGSEIVRGTIGENKVIAEASIAVYDKLSVSFMRRLMEMNYSLFYTRYALKDNKICLKFDSTIPDGPPRKLYYAFKELATRADKQDDLLLDDFATLKAIDNPPIEQLPEQEKELKYKYFQKWIQDTLKRIGELNEEQFSGGISYLLLNTAYKIDYLIVPQGTIMNEIEKISWGYFAQDNKPLLEKNRIMKAALQKLLDNPKEKVLEDLYNVKATFGIANPAPHTTVVDTFNRNVPNIKWYVENNYADIAIIIYEYLATYSLFTFGLPKPDAQLFALMINIINQDYYTELGFTEKYYDSANNKFNEQALKDKINEIIKNGLEQYPELKFKTENLKFDSLTNFLKTYVNEIQNLNFNN